MSETHKKPTVFGIPVKIDKKPTVFGIPVKIDPYTVVRVDRPEGEYVIPLKKPPKRQEPEPNSLVVEYPGRGPTSGSR